MRLTRKIEPQVWETFIFPKYDYNRDNYGALLSSTESIINKLGQLEDIEEELGIDLITLFKALKNGVYYFTNGTQLTKDYVWLLDNYISVGTRDKLSYSFMTAFGKQTLLLKDYGKTWALDKKDLTNE